MVSLSPFERKIAEFGCDGLYSQKIEIIQVNLGLRCNQQCTHCHLEASPKRTEMMQWPIMERVLEAAGYTRPRMIDLTGGAPELNPWFRRQISVGWDGTLYDCDFNLALGIPVNHGAPDHIQSFSPEELRTRRIVTGEHCFGCTAGSGSSCGGALV